MSVSTAERPVEFSCRPKQTLLAAALDAGIDWPHQCRVGSCGTCRCKITAGTSRALTSYEPVLSAEDIRRGHVLACRTVLTSDIDVTC